MSKIALENLQSNIALNQLVWLFYFR